MKIFSHPLIIFSFKFCIFSVFNLSINTPSLSNMSKEGIDINARINLIKSSKKENEICKNCSIRKRCKHTCACKNYVSTNDINELSPVVCETEKILIEASDKMAEKLYKQNSKMFIQKFYNKDYNILKQIANKYEKGR